MKWYPADWFNDTRSLSAEAKGCWIDLLGYMWNAPERGKWEGTYQEFARVTGIPWENAPTIIQELHKVATVTLRNKIVTLMSRRMIRQELHYKINSNRQRRWRSNASSNASVTIKTSDSSRLLKTTKTKAREARAPFIKPTAQEVTAYAKTIGFELDGNHWVDHYESNGWKVGRNPMQDWKAAVRTWKKKQGDFGGRPLATPAPRLPPPVRDPIIPPGEEVTYDMVTDLVKTLAKGKTLGGVQ